jgi:hypothetical protein
MYIQKGHSVPAQRDVETKPGGKEVALFIVVLLFAYSVLLFIFVAGNSPCVVVGAVV